jgi:hypothetical protein
MSLGVWRFVTCGEGVALEHCGNRLFEKDDLARFKYFTEDWWYYINQDGEAVTVNFPFKARPVLSWSPQKFTQKDGKLVAGHFAEQTFCQTDVLPTDMLPNRRFAERTFCRMDSLTNSFFSSF